MAAGVMTVWGVDESVRYAVVLAGGPSSRGSTGRFWAGYRPARAV